MELRRPCWKRAEETCALASRYNGRCGMMAWPRLCTHRPAVQRAQIVKSTFFCKLFCMRIANADASTARHPDGRHACFYATVNPFLDVFLGATDARR